MKYSNYMSCLIEPLTPISQWLIEPDSLRKSLISLLQDAVQYGRPWEGLDFLTAEPPVVSKSSISLLLEATQ